MRRLSLGFKIWNLGFLNDWLLLALVLLTPLIFDPFCMDAFSLPKLTVLRVLAIPLIVVYFIQIIQEGRLPWKWNGGAMAFFGFLVALTVSTLLSPARLVSLFGLYAFRMDGLLSWFIYAILFWLGLTWVNRQLLIRLVWALVMASFLVSLYAVLQYLGLDAVRWTADPTRGRIWSSFGNANFMGAYLAMTIPLSVSLLAALLLNFKFQSPKSKRFIVFGIWCLGFGILLSGWVVAQSLSRAAWLGAITGLGVFVFLGNEWKTVINKKRGVVMVLCLVGLGLAIPWKSVSSRLRQGLNAESPEWQLRKFGWKAAGRLVLEKPLLGFGAEGYHLNFRRHMDASFFRFTRQSLMSPVYPHNEFLQIGVSTGLVGLFIFFSFLIFLARAAWGARKDALCLGAAGSLVSSLMNNLFSFHNICTASLFFLLAGVLLGGEKEEPVTVLPTHLRNRPLQLGLIIGLVALASFGGFYSVQYYLADRAIKKANHLEQKGLMDKAARQYQRAVNLNPFEPTYLHALSQMGLYYFQKSADQQAQQNWLMKTDNVYKHLVRLNPLDALAWNGSGTVHARLFQIFQMPLSEKAAEAFTTASKLDPNLAEAWTNLGALYHAQGKKEESLEAYLKAKDVNPYAPQVYYDLGVFHALHAQFVQAERYWREALELNPNFTEAQTAMQMLSSGVLKQKYGGRK